MAASAQSSRNANIKNEHVRIHGNAPLKIPSQVFETKRITYDELLIKKWYDCRHWRRPGVFIVNFEHISYIFLVFLLLTLGK